MKRSFIIILVIFITFGVLNSCNKENQPPTCEITNPIELSEHPIGDKISIRVDSNDEDGSIEIVTLLINEQAVASNISATNTFLWETASFSEGVYVIKAIVIDDEGATATDKLVIRLKKAVVAPEAAFSGSPLVGEFNLAVNFIDESLNNPESWQWDFGDGNTSSDQNPTYTFNETGYYPITLTVENSFGSDTYEGENHIAVYVEGGTSGAPCPGTPTITDIDGNTYNTVLIGNQCWMKENLKVTHYPNGQTIPYIESYDAWNELDNNNLDDGYCFYDDSPSNSEYGPLYSYAAAIAKDWQNGHADSQGICPDGWHLPTDMDWMILEGIADSEYGIFHSEWEKSGLRGSDVGFNLKSDSGWIESNGIDLLGFEGYPAGFASGILDGYLYKNWQGQWWTATESNSEQAYSRSL